MLKLQKLRKMLAFDFLSGILYWIVIFLDTLKEIVFFFFFKSNIFVHKRDARVHIDILTQPREMSKGDLLATARNQILPDTCIKRHSPEGGPDRYYRPIR